MTLSTTTTLVNANGNGALLAFSFNFKTLDSSHITVSLDDVVQGSGFGVVLNGDQDNSPGGTVTFSVAPGSGVTVTIEREVPLTQQVDYVPYDSFPAETHEAALDKLTMQTQENNEKVNRAVKAPGSDDGTTDFTLPAYEAGKVLAWEPGLKKLENATVFLQDDPIGGLSLSNNIYRSTTLGDDLSGVNESTVAKATSKTVGPTGSGANIEEGGLNFLPAGTNWIEVLVSVQVACFALGVFAHMKVAANNGDVIAAIGADGAGLIGEAERLAVNNVSISRRATMITKIPLNSSKVFSIIWDTTSNTPANVTGELFNMRILGFGI